MKPWEFDSHGDDSRRCSEHLDKSVASHVAPRAIDVDAAAVARLVAALQEVSC
jgi:hypothetical protein